MTSTLTAKEQSLARIFSDDYVFTIPSYQRPYSWGTEQARELLEDLLDYMQAEGRKTDELAPYFLGSIVLIKREASSDATVVDGQQRLTTLTILLSAIRATVENVDVRTGITKCIYEQGNVVFGTEPRYRLSLRERDRDFFRMYVQHVDGIEKLIRLNDTLPDAQERLRRNAQLFIDTLAEKDEATLIQLAKFIITRCYLVTVATPDLDSAYRIFGVMNSRGLDLSATDILKAEIIGRIDPAKREAYTEKWEDLEEELGRDAFGDLFSHIRMVYRKVKPKGTLLKEFRDHVGPPEPIRFVDEVLEPMAEAFREITDADYSSQRHAEKINLCLRWLNKLEFKDWVPPALAFFARHRNEPERMHQFFVDLERLAYSMLVRRSGVNVRIDRFAELTKAIENKAELFDPASPLQLSPVEQQLTYEALSGPLYLNYAARAVAVLMLRLDSLVSGGGATYDYDTITVEHVLPQQPRAGSQWLEWVPEARDRLHWVHRLGNLTLLTRKKNSSASNYDFDKKKNAYFTKGGVSPFVLTTQVIQHSEWTVDELEERQRQLLDVFESHWRLEDRQTPLSRAIDIMNAKDGQSESPLFVIDGKKGNVSAKGCIVDGKFVVRAGSTARVEWIGQDYGYKFLRQDLVSSGKLEPSSEDSMRFSCDVEFDSPSAASAVIFGRADNGRTSWKLAETGQSLADWMGGESVPSNATDDDGRLRRVDRSRVMLDFWTQFIERALPHTRLFARRSPTPAHWLSVGAGRPGFWLVGTVKKTSARAECYVALPQDRGERSTQAFEALRAQRSEIEALFGGPLDWDQLPGRIGSRISVDIDGGWELPESEWGALQERMIQRLVRLDAALREHIRQLEL